MLNLKLMEPVKYGSETISELNVRKPKAKDLRGLSTQPSTSDMLNLAAKLCNVAPSVIDELEIPDTLKLLEVVGDFMQGGQVTGSKG